MNNEVKLTPLASVVFYVYMSLAEEQLYDTDFVSVQELLSFGAMENYGQDEMFVAISRAVNDGLMVPCFLIDEFGRAILGVRGHASMFGVASDVIAAGTTNG